MVDRDGDRSSYTPIRAAMGEVYEHMDDEGALAGRDSAMGLLFDLVAHQGNTHFDMAM